MFSGAAAVENFADGAGDERDDDNDQAAVLQWKQPYRDCGGSHSKDQDVEASAKLVHRIDDVQVVIAEAELNFNQHSDTDETLVAEVKSKGERLGEVVPP